MPLAYCTLRPPARAARSLFPARSPTNTIGVLAGVEWAEQVANKRREEIEAKKAAIEAETNRIKAEVEAERSNAKVAAEMLAAEESIAKEMESKSSCPTFRIWLLPWWSVVWPLPLHVA